MAFLNLNSVANSGWTRVGAATDVEAINDPIIKPNDTNYLQVLGDTPDAILSWGALFPGHQINFPPHYTAILDYGDNHAGEQFRVNRFAIHARMALQSAGTVEIVYNAAFIGFVGDFITFSVSNVAPNYLDYTFEIQGVPPHNSPLELGDLTTSFHALWIRPAQAATNSAVNLRVSRVYFVALEGIGPGGRKARIGPNLTEPSLYCAICSFPFHLRDLVKVENQRHPMNGRWVCRDDFDEINPEPRDPIIEGDIDFDL